MRASKALRFEPALLAGYAGVHSTAFPVKLYSVNHEGIIKHEVTERIQMDCWRFIMKFIKRHKGAFLILLFCSVVTIILILAVCLFDYAKSHSLIDTKEALGAFASYYGAIIGGMLSGFLAIAGVFVSLYFYQERFREEDVKKVQPFLKLEATNRGHSHGMILSGLNLTGIEDPSRNAYPIEFCAKNIGNGYLKAHSIRFNEMAADEDSLSFVLNANEQSTFVINVEKESKVQPFQLTIEYYDSMSNHYTQEYKVNCDDRRYYVENGYPRIC